MAWEVSPNETQMPIFVMEELGIIVHEEFPDENVYSCGWMDDVYDIYLQARQHRILHPHELKDKPYSVSEYGDWEYYSKNAGLNQDQLPNDLRDEMSSRQARANHRFHSILAYVKLEKFRLAHGTDHFAMKAKAYLAAVMAAIQRTGQD